MFAHPRSVTRLLWVLFLCQPAGAPAQQTGCYAVGYGPVFPGLYAGKPLIERWPVPYRLELRAEVDTGVHDDTARLVSAVPRESSPRARTPFPTVWRRVGRDSITLFWDPAMLTGGFSLGGQTSFELRVSGDTLRGIADFEPDPVPYLGDDWAKVLAVRVPCDADTAAWRARVADLAAWGKAQPIDTALGVSRAVEAFERLSQADSGTGPTYFGNLIRNFYTKHGRFPRTAVEAYMDDPFMRLLPPDPFLRDTHGVPYRFIPHGRYFDVIEPGRVMRVTVNR